MPSDNRISASLTPEQRQQFLDALNTATQIVTDFAVNLTPAERRKLVGIGVERAGMLDTFPQEMAANPALVPQFIDMDETNKDLVLVRDLMVLHQATAVLLEKLDDTMKLATSDLFTAFSAFYASVKEARRRNVPGADTVFDRLSPYFARGLRSGAVKTDNPQ